MGELVSQQLGALGFAITFTPQPFAEMSSALLNQRFDVALIGWENIGADPAISTFWQRRADQPGSGLNFASWQDDEVDRLLDEAAQLPGCDAAERGDRYRQVQRRLYEQTAAIFLGGPLKSWAYGARWRTIEPGPWAFDANIAAWSSSGIDN
jgi:peptide/nickel transport system substrate-binding protein